MESNKRDVIGLFEESIDENEQDKENLDETSEQVNVLTIKKKSSSKKSNSTKKTPKRLQKKAIELKNENNQSDIFDFTPEKSKSKKKLNKSSTKKSQGALKSIENDEVDQSKSKKKPKYSSKLSSHEKAELDDELDKLAKEHEEIANYKLIVE